MVLAILTEKGAVRVDHRGGIVVDAGDRHFIHRHHEHDGQFARQILHQVRRRPVGNRLGRGIPLRILFGAEVWAVEELLQAYDLRAARRGFPNELDVFLDRTRLVHLDRFGPVGFVVRLDQADRDDVGRRAHRATGKKGCDLTKVPAPASPVKRASSTIMRPREKT